jgi:hypothetical protein
VLNLYNSTLDRHRLAAVLTANQPPHVRDAAREEEGRTRLTGRVDVE